MSAKKTHPKLERASRCAHAAVEMDNLGNKKEAAELYAQAIQFLDQALTDPSFNQSHSSVERCRASYAARVDALSREMAGTLEVLPAPPNDSGAVVPSAPHASTELAKRDRDPTVLEVGTHAIKAANQHGGKYLVQGYSTARELNERHKVTETVAAGVKSTYHAAVTANEKYKIVDKAKTGVSTACTSAKELNQKHHITEKVGTIASASVRKVGELNRDYKVTERVGSALLSGLNYLSSQSQQYLASSSSSKAQLPDPSTSTPSSSAHK